MTAHALNIAWNEIHNKEIAININHRPEISPVELWHLKRIAAEHRPEHSGRRFEKGRAKACGQVLKRSFVKPQTSIEQ